VLIIKYWNRCWCRDAHQCADSLTCGYANAVMYWSEFCMNAMGTVPWYPAGKSWEWRNLKHCSNWGDGYSTRGNTEVMVQYQGSYRRCGYISRLWCGYISRLWLTAHSFAYLNFGGVQYLVFTFWLQLFWFLIVITKRGYIFHYFLNGMPFLSENRSTKLGFSWAVLSYE